LDGDTKENPEASSATLATSPGTVTELPSPGRTPSTLFQREAFVTFVIFVP